MADPKAPNEYSTEAVNPRTLDLDRLPTHDVLERLLDEDATVAAAVRAALPDLTVGAERLHAALAGGGRWINLGAGTSGRIGVLDAAEIPPTFGLEPHRVQALIAGGETALRQAVEGAEDDATGAHAGLEALSLGANDVVVALSASGRTPYVLGAVERAHAVGAGSIAVTCTPGSPLAHAVEIAIVADTGAEAIAGSTRMKAGLAQKMILHALSTSVMVKLGRVRGNRMVELQTLNSKLRERARHTVMDLAGVDAGTADAALEQAGGSVSAALDRLARS